MSHIQQIKKKMVRWRIVTFFPDFFISVIKCISIHFNTFSYSTFTMLKSKLHVRRCIEMYRNTFSYSTFCFGNFHLQFSNTVNAYEQ